MKKKSSERPSAADAHLEHLKAHEEHGYWLKELERWRIEYRQALQRFARRLLPELELGNFEEALERHEAAILAHEELVDRHEQRLRKEKSGVAEHSEDADDLHQQMLQRHDLSRREHEQLARSHQAILRALEMFSRDSLG